MPHWVLRGLIEMIRARLVLYRTKPGDIAALNASADAANKSGAVSNSDRQAIERVAFIVALLGRKLPWRSGCLIQAIAGQRWLSRLGIATRITVGVERPENGELSAHAWLKRGEEVIVGGEIDRFHALIGDT